MQFVSSGSAGSQILCPCCSNCNSARATRYFWMADFALSAADLSSFGGLSGRARHGEPGNEAFSANLLLVGPVDAANTCQCASVPRGPRLGRVPRTPRKEGCPITQIRENRIIHANRETA